MDKAQIRFRIEFLPLSLHGLDVQTVLYQSRFYESENYLFIVFFKGVNFYYLTSPQLATSPLNINFLFRWIQASHHFRLTNSFVLTSFINLLHCLLCNIVVLITKKIK